MGGCRADAATGLAAARPPHAPWVALLLFAITFLVYQAAPVDHMGADPRFGLLNTENMLSRRTFDLVRFFDVDTDPYGLGADLWSPRPPGATPLSWGVKHREEAGRVVFAYPAGPSVLASPVVLALNAAGVHSITETGGFDPHGERRLHRWTAALATAGAVAVFYWCCSGLLAGGWAVFLALAFAFGSALLSTCSRAVWSDTFGVLLLAGALCLVWGLPRTGRVPGRRWAAIASLLAWTVYCKPPYALSVVAVSLWVVWRHPRGLPAYALAGMAWAALFSGHSKLLWDHWLPPYYSASTVGGATSGWTTEVDFLGGMTGVLFSPSRGLLIFNPWIVLAAVLVAVRWRHIARPDLVALCIAGIAGQVVLHAFWPNWMGGYSFGARLMAGALPWTMFLCAETLAGFPGGVLPRRWAVGVVAVALAGCALHLPGGWSWKAWHWNNRLGPTFDSAHAAVWDWRNPQFLEAYRPRAPYPFGFPPLPQDGVIRMGGEESNPYLWYGWGEHAEGFRWTTGRRAGLSFSATPGRNLGIRVRYFPLGPGDGGGGLRARVELNGEGIGRIHSDGFDIQEAALWARGDLVADKNTLEFEFREVHRPRSFAGEGLAAGFIEVQVDELE